MGIIEFIIIAAILGAVVWVIHAYTPIPAAIKKIILWAAVIVLILILAHALGLIGKDVKIPSIR